MPIIFWGIAVEFILLATSYDLSSTSICLHEVVVLNALQQNGPFVVQRMYSKNSQSYEYASFV